MEFDKDIHHRKSIRLRAYDYSQPGAYFITICTHQRQPLFGDIVDDGMMLNAAGLMVEKCWREIPQHYPGIELGEQVVMPNHFHGIVHISDAHHVGAQFIAPHNCDQCPIDQSAMNQGAMNRAPTVGDIIRGFKARCTHGINKVNSTTGQPVWQRNYYEHIIRNDQAYQNIVEYICTNPQKWQDDTYYVQTH
jgi:REP element-mobilizing transposase RayT